MHARQLSDFIKYNKKLNNYYFRTYFKIVLNQKNYIRRYAKYLTDPKDVLISQIISIKILLTD